MLTFIKQRKADCHSSPDLNRKNGRFNSSIQRCKITMHATVFPKYGRSTRKCELDLKEAFVSGARNVVI